MEIRENSDILNFKIYIGIGLWTYVQITGFWLLLSLIFIIIRPTI